MMCSGVGQREVELLLAKLASLDTASCTWDALRAFMGADWRSFKAVGGSRAAAKFSAPFSTARGKHSKKTGHFASGASDILDVLGLLRLLASRPAWVVLALKAEILSFAALCKVVCCYRRCKRSSDAADDFAQALHDHGLAFSGAYGDEDRLVYIPKFHFLSMCQTRSRQTALLWIHSFRRGITFTRRPSQSMWETWSNSSNPSYHGHYRTTYACCKLTLAFGRVFQPEVWAEMHAEGHQPRIANSMVWANLKIPTDDIIRISGGSFTSVRACVELDGDLGIVIETLHKVEEVNGVGSRLQPDASLRIQKLDGSMSVRFCPAWSVEPDGRI